MVRVLPVCRRTPLTSSHMSRPRTSSISSGVTSHGPAGLNVSADLPLTHCPPRSVWEARSLTSLTTTPPAPASRAPPPGDGGAGPLDRVEVAGAPADDEAELDLPVRLRRAAGDADVVVGTDDGV